jgi:predicted component of type VI protein secretion system
MSAQFDPEAIATKIRSESGLGAMLPYARDARCWALYVEHYRALQSSGAETSADSLLAPLALAYARQVRRGA